jgi:hypothetical protein
MLTMSAGRRRGGDGGFGSSQRRRKIWGTGRGALVAALGRKRRERLGFSLGFSRGWLKGGGGLAWGCLVTFAGRSHASSVREKTIKRIDASTLRAEKDGLQDEGGLLRLGREK